jgi:hypothetical protein
MEEAQALLQRALAIHERIGGPDSPESARAQLALAEMLLSRHEAAKAGELIESALRNLGRELEPDHPLVQRARALTLTRTTVRPLPQER